MESLAQLGEGAGKARLDGADRQPELRRDLLRLQVVIEAQEHDLTVVRAEGFDVLQQPARDVELACDTRRIGRIADLGNDLFPRTSPTVGADAPRRAVAQDAGQPRQPAVLGAGLAATRLHVGFLDQVFGGELVAGETAREGAQERSMLLELDFEGHLGPSVYGVYPVCSRRVLIGVTKHRFSFCRGGAGVCASDGGSA